MTIPDFQMLVSALAEMPGTQIKVILLLRPMGSSVVSTTLRRHFGNPFTQVPILSVAQDQLLTHLAMARALPETRKVLSIMPFPFYDVYQEPSALANKLWDFLDLEKTGDGHLGKEKQNMINNFLDMKKRPSSGGSKDNSHSKASPELLWRREVGKDLEEVIDHFSYTSSLLLPLKRGTMTFTDEWLADGVR